MSTSGVYFKFGRKITGFDTFVSSGGLTLLVIASSPFQIVTGVADHTVKLPSGVTLGLHRYFNIINNGTGDVTVQDGAGTNIAIVGANSFGYFRIKAVGTLAGTWTYTLSTTSGGGTSVSAVDKLDFLQGIANLNYNDGTSVSKKVILNPEEIGADYWTTVKSLTTARFSCSNFTVGGFALAVGGFNVSCQGTVDRYDDNNQYWLNRAPLLSARELSFGWDSGGFGYATCGDGNPVVTYLASTEQYDITLDSWASKAPTSQARNHLGGFKVGDFGHAVGGVNASTYYDLNERYDQATDSWSFRAPLITARREYGSFGIDGKGYAFAGVGVGATPLQSTEVYLEAINAWRSLSNYPITNSGMAAYSVLGFGYSAGGNSSTTTTRKYNPLLDSWVSVSSLGAAVADTTAAVLNHQAYTLGVSTPLGTVQRYKAFSYYNLGTFKSSKSNPTAMLFSAAILELFPTLPVQARSDGDNWKTFTAGKDGVLKDSEALAIKFKESGLVYVAGGSAGPGGYASYASSESYNPVTNVWTPRANMAVARAHPFGFSVEGYGILAAGTTPSLVTFPAITSVERYDELLDAFSSRNPLTTGAFLGMGYALLGFGFATGGVTTTLGLDTNQRYSNSSNSWLNKAVIPVTFAQHVGWALFDQGYVSSGSPDSSGSVQDIGYKYNPIIDAWSAIAVAPSADRQVSGFAYNGAGYRVSGVSVSATAVHKYNPTTDAWSTVTALNANGTNSAGLASGGRGYRVNNDSNSVAAEYYNDENSTWTTTANTNVGRREAASHFTPGVFRNYEVRVGLPALVAGLGAGAWTTKAPYPTLVSGTYMLTLNGFLHAAAGYNGGGLSTSYKFSEGLNAWILGSPVTADSSSGDSGVVLEGFGYGPGGAVGGATTTIRKLNGDTEVWSNGTAMNRAHLSHGAFPLNGMLYVTGGNGAGAVGGIHDQYNPQTDAWTAKTSMTQLRDQNPSDALFGFGYNFGGYDGTNSHTVTERYDDAGDYWIAVASHSATRRGSGAAVVDDKIHTYGGYDSGVIFNNTLEVYDPVINAWAFKTSKVSIGYGISGAPLGNTAYAVGGNSGPNVDVVEQFQPSKNKLVMGVALRVEE